MVNNENESWRKLKTVQTALDIIEALIDLNGAGVAEVTEYVGQSQSTVHSQLSTLYEAGYLVKQNNKYCLSFQFLLLGEYVRNNSLLYQFGQTIADDLASQTGHYAHLFTAENGHGINIYESRGQQAGKYEYQSLKLQQREPLHVTAAGKVLLAHFTEERVSDIIRLRGLDQWTTNTITDKNELFNELETIRDQGYAINDEEEIDGFRAVASPIHVGGDEVIGSVSVSGPLTYFDDEKIQNELPKLVKNAAGMIEVEINMSNEIS